jgi:hypothetical protein
VLAPILLVALLLGSRKVSQILEERHKQKMFDIEMKANPSAQHEGGSASNLVGVASPNHQKKRHLLRLALFVLIYTMACAELGILGFTIFDTVQFVQTTITDPGQAATMMASARTSNYLGVDCAITTDTQRAHCVCSSASGNWNCSAR